MVVIAAMLLSTAFISNSTSAQSSGRSLINCAQPLGGTPESSRKVVSDAYQAWKATYVTSDGAGGDLRVQRSSFDQYDTVSEGIAYGMLFAVYNNDKSTFDGLWAYAQKHFNQNGVMNWRIASDGSTIGYNGATDADQDMAAALITADTTWGGYRLAAVDRIQTVLRHQVEANTGIVKPGDVWGGSSLLNVSYLAPSYYDVFKAYAGDATWTTVKAKSQTVLKASQHPTTGLFPDWSDAQGNPTNGMSHNYGYDASRTPLRLALGAAWTCDQTDAQLLTPFNTWFASRDNATLASSYNLDGTPVDRGDATPLRAAIAAAATASRNDEYRVASWNALQSAPSTSYYPDSMRLFGLMVASGVMVNPLNIAKQTPVLPAPTAALKSFIMTSSDVSVTGLSSQEISINFAAPQPQTGLVLDIEIYDDQNQKVAQTVYENQTLSADSKTYTIRWTPARTGTYTVRGGIFTAGWSSVLLWNNETATVRVTQAPVPTPPVVVPSIIIPTLQKANISIWWPGNVHAVSGVQPFKAVVDGQSVDSYDMYWQVDGDRLNKMDTVRDAAPHKLSVVNLADWNWSSNGTYTITFTAKDALGITIAQKSTVITVGL